MIKMTDIVTQEQKSIHEKSIPVKLPLTDEDKKVCFDLMQYLILSQDSEKSAELGLRPGVGIAAPQIGYNKRIFAVLIDDFKGNLYRLCFINPTIYNKSKEMIYIDEGEGCLSVTGTYEGVNLRHKSIMIKSYIYDYEKQSLKKIKMQVEDYPAIVIQHEYDHLDGVLFIDKLTKVEEIPTDAIPLSKILSALQETVDKEAI